ncbi:hypothetical protein L596_004641 [Steinernema carpocapsae]|uniref:Uncharacterized protein n=1 Tax=Steinernema carpocapsae TaxID=34508 RepID=A0A4U8UY18_STECR|nr:hypothetical protein L596_004641 [Steinernema carpocapsae]
MFSVLLSVVGQEHKWGLTTPCKVDEGDLSFTKESLMDVDDELYSRRQNLLLIFDRAPTRKLKGRSVDSVENQPLRIDFLCKSQNSFYRKAAYRDPARIAQWIFA